MSQKLLTLEELSAELGIKESAIKRLVEEKIIFAYRIGGELLRFRREQIEAQRKEIFSRCEDSDLISSGEMRRDSLERTLPFGPGNERQKARFGEKLKDFFYFYDFYFIAAVIALILLLYIFLT